MKKIVCLILCCFLLGCQTAPQEVRFKNPLFYDKMLYAKNENWWALLTPTSMKTHDDVSTDEVSCFLVENEEEYIILNCETIPLGETKPNAQKRELSKFVLRPRFGEENYYYVQHFFKDETESADFFNWFPYIIRVNNSNQ